MMTSTTSSSDDLEYNKEKLDHVCSLICPTFDYLINEKIVNNVTCIVPNCDEIFSSQSCLNLHLNKVHRIFNQTNQTNEILLTRAKSKSQKIQDNCHCKYYCPIQKCKFFIGSQAYLPTYHSLKNHFIRMHGKKSFNCLKCNKIFAIKSEMQRHAENCGTIFKCPTCECPYATKSSLLKHMRKKNHNPIIIPSSSEPPKKLLSPSQLEKVTTSSKQKYVKIAPLVVTDQFKQQQQQSSSIIFIQIDNNNNLDYNQRSFGCQTQFNNNNNNNINNITQETASQTISQFQNQSSNYCEFYSIATSTDDNNNNNNINNQETQTLTKSNNNSILTPDEEYMNMLLSDISTQTQMNEFPAELTYNTGNKSLNTAFTQTTSNIGISNLELANLDDEIYFNNNVEIVDESNSFATSTSTSTSTSDDNHHHHQQQTYYESNHNFDYPSSLSYACQTCQTDDYFLLNTTNTNSIQTQTTQNIYYNNSNDSRYIDNSKLIDTITQTDWNLIDQNSF